MRYFSLTSLGSLACFVVILSGSFYLIQAEPILAVTEPVQKTIPSILLVSAESSSQRIDSKKIKPTLKNEKSLEMPDHRIAEVLADHLDHYPSERIFSLAQHIQFICKKYDFDPAFILSLIQVESNFRIGATSPVGAVGLMQLMLPTAKFVLEGFSFPFSGYEKFEHHILRTRPMTVSLLRDPFVNTTLGIAYLSWLRDRYKGSTFYSVAAYNVGPARMDGWLAQKSFQPVETKKYFEAILRRVPVFRTYQASKRGRASRRLKKAPPCIRAQISIHQA